MATEIWLGTWIAAGIALQASPELVVAAPASEASLEEIGAKTATPREGTTQRPFHCDHRQEALGSKAAECVMMLPQQRWRGLWRNDFEGSQFCPEPASRCEFDSPGDKIWLSARPDRRPDGKLYRVDFVGRRTMYPGSYGHVGAFDHELIIDRMIIYGEEFQ